MQNLKDLRQALPPSRMGGGAAPVARPLGTAFRADAAARPASSINAAKYNSNKLKDKAEQLQLKNEVAAASSPDEMLKKVQKDINSLLQQSATASLKNQHGQALQLAKEAVNKDKTQRKIMESMNASEGNQLSYSVQFTLALCLQKNGMLQEALAKYNEIIKSKQYQQAGRLHLNIGNIQFQHKNYEEAIKNYRKAIDTIPPANKEIRMKIHKNIGLALVKQGKYIEAIKNYEIVTKSIMDHKAMFNLLLCLYTLGDKARMKEYFVSMLSISDFDAQEEAPEDEEKHSLNDRLREELNAKRREVLKYILMAAKLLAETVETDVIEGYNWILAKVKSSEYHEAESEIEIFKAMALLKNKEIEKAIETLKALEKKDKTVMARVATNISFLYFLENDFKNAEKYAELSIKHNRYNPKALVNKGNCLYVKNQFLRAKECYLEAIGVEADCIEAIYNLGYVHKKLNNSIEALQCLEKLQTVVSIPEGMFQIAHINENIGNTKQALKWYQLILNKVPNDAGILARVGHIFFREDDEQQALHYYMESYRLLPTNIETNTWLGIYYVKQELYEKACHFLERASQLQPKEIKWRLMVASCQRRIGNYQRALKIYEAIYSDYPHNIECLRFLVIICQEMGLPYEEYATTLKRLEYELEADSDNFNQGSEEQRPEPEEPRLEENVQDPAKRDQRKKQPKKQQQAEAEDYDNFDMDLQYK